MHSIIPLRKDIVEYIQVHDLVKKWRKVIQLFASNPRHPSLHTELLYPKENLIYSFRIDRKYRALFIIRDDRTIEIIKVTAHYR